MLNLMLDLEAFGPRPRGLIVSVGAVVFDDELPPERCVLEGDENRFYGVLDSQDARDARFVVDGDTMAWWATQGQAFAQLMVEMSTRGERIEALFGRLAAWLSRFKGTPIRHWHNAPSYDALMLETTFKALGLESPLSYKTERDYRTMMELAHGAVRLGVPVSGVHNALFDAVEQAKLATAALQKLRAQPAVPLIIEGYPSASDMPALAAIAPAEVERVVNNPAVKSFPSVGAPEAATPPGQVKVPAPAADPSALKASASTPAAAQKPPASARWMDVKTATAVVALDIDGVLQTPALQDWQEMEHAGAVIELLAEMPHLGILVSATDRETSSAAAVVAMLPDEIARRVVGVTEVTKGGRSDGGRQAEIEAWLAAHPHITTWVAVDDEACLFRKECPWLVQTYKWMGWTDDTTQGVRALLAGRRPEVKLTPSLGRSSSLPANWADPEADPEGDFDVRAMQDKARRDAQEREDWAKNPVPGQQSGRPIARSALVQDVLDSPSIIGTKPASKEPPRVLRDRGRALEQNNARPGGWRGLLGIGDKKS